MTYDVVAVNIDTAVLRVVETGKWASWQRTAMLLPGLRNPPGIG